MDKNVLRAKSVFYRLQCDYLFFPDMLLISMSGRSSNFLNKFFFFRKNGATIRICLWHGSITGHAFLILVVSFFSFCRWHSHFAEQLSSSDKSRDAYYPPQSHLLGSLSDSKLVKVLFS